MTSNIARGISHHPEEANISVPVYGPESIRKKGAEWEFMVRLNGVHVPLPFYHVGGVWFVYADVSINKPLAYHARNAMVSRGVGLIRENPNILAAVTPQSAKSQGFVRDVVHDISKILHREIPLIQLLGDEDEAKIVAESAPGLVTDCVSVVSKAKGITKRIGMREPDRRLLTMLGGDVLWLDDVANTNVTRDKSWLLVNRAMGIDESTPHTSLVIFLESEYGPTYPKKFTNIQALGHLPEFVGDLPHVRLL